LKCDELERRALLIARSPGVFYADCRSIRDRIAPAEWSQLRLAGTPWYRCESKIAVGQASYSAAQPGNHHADHSLGAAKGAVSHFASRANQPFVPVKVMPHLESMLERPL
jgi:hypothetical protein